MLNHIVCEKKMGSAILVETVERNINTKRITKEEEMEDWMASEEIDQGPAKHPIHTE